jgi:hypothetical protein
LFCFPVEAPKDLFMKIVKILITVCAILALTHASAQTVPAASDADITERINFIQNEMNNERVYATLWTCGWTVINGTSAAYFYYKAANTRNKANQVNDMVIGVGSTLAVIGNVATPLVSMYAPYFLNDLPDGTRDEKLTKLAKAEDYLRYGAKLETFGRSWIAQSINLATASAGAFVVGVAYRKTMKDYGKNPTKEALITFCECFISGELQMLSQPMRLVSAQTRYNEKYGKSEANQNHTVMFFAYPDLSANSGLVAGVSLYF